MVDKERSLLKQGAGMWPTPNQHVNSVGIVPNKSLLCLASAFSIGCPVLAALFFRVLSQRVETSYFNSNDFLMLLYPKSSALH